MSHFEPCHALSKIPMFLIKEDNYVCLGIGFIEGCLPLCAKIYFEYFSTKWPSEQNSVKDFEAV